MSKRIWHLLSAIVLASFIVAACAAPAPAPAPQAAAPTTAPAAAPTAAPAAKPTTPPAAPAAAATAAPTAAAAAKPAGTIWSSRALVIGACCDEPKSIDPAVAIDIPGTRIVTAAYEGLTRYKPGKPEIEPWLATSWTISPDSLIYTFKLRKGVKFHDGTEFNADAVKASFDRVKAMKLGVAFFLDAMSEVKIVDDATVQITLSKPDIAFFYGVPRIKIISPAALKANQKGTDWAADFFRENTVGTGPYKLNRWDRGRQTEMVAFPDYWKGWEGKHIQRIVDRYSLDLSTKLLLLEQGELDLVEPVNISDVKRLKANAKIKIDAVDVIRGYYHTINNQRGPLKDPRVRQAMLLAFPYDQMIGDLMAGYATPMKSMTTSNMDGYCAVGEPKQDLKKAKELLAQAGYPNGGFKLSLIYLPGIEPERQSAQLFKAALAELNIDLDIQQKEWGTLLEAQKRVETAPDFSALYVTSPIPYAGAQLFRLGHSSIKGTSYNWQFYDNPEFDKLVEEAQRTTDAPKRNDLLCKAQKMMTDDAAIMPIMNQQNLTAVRTRLVGFTYDPYGYTFDVHAYDLHIEGD
ncbi:MAG: ABC transporter substrate-binding protein [Chloroflexi bacterium]|nr:ABC transporter substrate-binding protein [Chloroflexota bacterium]